MKTQFEYPTLEQLSLWVNGELIDFFETDVECLNEKFTSGQDVRELGVWPTINNPLEVIVKELEEDVAGRYNDENRSITIIPTIQSAEDLRDILLHEMIHAFEYSFHAEHPCYKSALKELMLIHYYDQAVIKFRKEVVQGWITIDQHASNTVYHTPFFMLKSILLDNQLSLPIGTIYGYERTFKPN